MAARAPRGAFTRKSSGKRLVRRQLPADMPRAFANLQGRRSIVTNMGEAS
jgi:hypothetical protein